MSRELIALLVGIAVSWALEVVPYLKDYWSEWEYKPLTLWGLFEIIPVGAWALTCFAGFDWFQAPVCTLQGGVDAFLLGMWAFMSSQTNFTLAARKTENAVSRREYD